MALILTSRATRIVQPSGPCAVDFTHPLAKYAAAAWAGHRHNFDALGNAMQWVGSGIESRVGFDGIEQYQTGRTESLGYWVDKRIGAFDTDDFFIQCRVTPGVNPSGTAFIAKGDAGGGEWMIGDPSSVGSNIRFYGAAGGINAASGINAFPDGVKSTVSATRVAGVLQVFINGVLVSTDATSSGSLSDLTHHMTLCGADYSGTTFDTARNYIGGISQAVVLRGIGGESVAQELSRNPWQLFRPQSRSIIIDLGAGGGGTSLSFESATFTMNATAFNTSLSAQLGSASFLLSGEELSSEAAALLEVDNTSFNLTGDSFTPNQTLSVGSSTFNQTSQDIDFLTNVNPDIGSTNFNFDATFLVLPFVLSISDALNGIIYTKLLENDYKGTLNEMLHSFFGGVGSLQDRERAWLILQTGVDQGTNQDLWNTYLESFGYTGSLPDMLKEFWINY